MRASIVAFLNNQLSRLSVRVVRLASASVPSEAARAPVPNVLRAEHVEGAKLFADRGDLIKSLSHLRGKTIAEVGVGYGALRVSFSMSSSRSAFTPTTSFAFTKSL